MKIAFPALVEYTSYRSYFQDFLKVNETNKSFSQRMVAKRLNWPISYISDLLANRKRLSVLRALQFAKLAKFDSFDTERFITLLFLTDNDEVVRNYFDNQLKAKQNHAPQKNSEISNKLFLSLELVAVYDVLRWAKHSLSAKDIKRLLITFPDLTEQRIQDIMNDLVRFKLAQYNSSGKLTILIQNVYLDEAFSPDNHEDLTRIHQEYTSNLQRSLCRQTKPRLLLSGFVNLPTERFDEIKSKFLILRNSLIEIEKEFDSTRKDFEGVLFQFDLNMFPIIENNLLE